MKIAYIITRSDSIGGANIHVADMAHRMSNLGHSVTVLAGGSGPFLNLLDAKGIKYFCVQSLQREISLSHDFQAFLEIRSILKKQKPNLVSTHTSKAGFLGRIASFSLGIPVLYTPHGWSFSEGVPRKKSYMYLALERLCAPFCYKIINVCDYDTILAKANKIASDDKLITIHNGMPDVEKKYLSSSENKPLIITMIGRFEKQKDHFTLIKALAGLKHLDWELHLIGDGPFLSVIQNESINRGIRERIKFYGAIEPLKVPNVLSQSNIFVLSTNWEGFPRSILEAMRAGLPVVATNVAGVSEAIEDGRNGFLVPRNDVDTLKEKLLLLMTNPILRQTMGEKGKRKFQKCFTFDRMFENTYNLYQQIRT